MVALNRADLKLIKSALGDIIPNRSSIPILENVLVKERPDSVTVQGTDLEIAATVQLDGFAEPRELSYLVPWLEIKRAQDSIWLEMQESGRLKITCSGAEREIVPDEVEYYPVFKMEPGERIIDLGPEQWRRLDKFSFAVSRDATRGTLQGIGLDNGDGAVCAALCDGHRLAVVHGIGFVEQSEAFSETWPLAVVKIINRLGSGAGIFNEKLQDGGDADARIAVMSYVTLRFKPLDGSYVKWRPIVPKNNELAYSLSVAAADLLRVLKTMGTKAETTKHKPAPLVFKVLDDLRELQLTQNSFDEDGPKVTATIPCVANWPGLFGMTARYIQDIAKAAERNDLIFEYDDVKSAFRVQIAEYPDVTVVQMPVSLPDN